MSDKTCESMKIKPNCFSRAVEWLLEWILDAFEWLVKEDWHYA